MVAIVMMLLTATLQGLVSSQKTFLFANAFERMTDLVRQARSLAVTAKAQMDFTDYDNDGCTDTVTNPVIPGACQAPDFVTPAHYGVYFDTSNTNAQKIVLFADLHTDGSNAEGQFNAGGTPGVYMGGLDYVLAEYTLPPGYDFVFLGSGNQTVFYTPIFADTTFEPPLDPINGPFFIFGLATNSPKKAKCLKIHPVAGVPEVATNNDYNGC